MPPFDFNANKRHKPRHEFIPAPSSGAYAILVGMYKAEKNELLTVMSKQQVLDFAIKYSKANLSDKTKIWTSIKGLVDKALIDRQIARDPLYYMLDEGKALASKLVALEDGAPVPGQQNTNSNPPDDSSCDTRQSESQFTLSQTPLTATFEHFTLKAGTFDVILIVDQREKLETQQLNSSIKFETRTLACGDFLWIARPKDVNPNDKTKDLVLDYIVERKRLDDLQSSLIDGRFMQQKVRLKNAGVRKPCYLIEDYGRLREGRMTASSLNQAVTGIEIHDEMTVERVRNQAAALEYLTKMTKCIERFLEKRKLDLVASTQEQIKNGTAEQNEFMTFSEFQTKGAKITNWTVREMFAKHLIQISGMSDKKVAAILEHYSTPYALLNAYEKCNNEQQRSTLLSKLQIPHSNRAIGPVVSNRVYLNYAKPHTMF